MALLRGIAMDGMLMNTDFSYTPQHSSPEPVSISAETDAEDPAGRHSVTHSSLAVADAIVSLLGVVVASFVFGGLAAGNGEHFAFGVAGAVGLWVMLWWRNAYVETRSVVWKGKTDLLLSCVGRVGLAGVVVAWLLDAGASRWWWLALLGMWATSMTLTRVLWPKAKGDREPVKVIVAGNTGDALSTRLALRSDAQNNYEVQGFVMDQLDGSVPEIVSQMALGATKHLPHIAKRSGTDLVVICLGAIDAERFAPLVRQLNVLGIEVALSTGLSNVALRRVRLGQVGGRPLVRITPAPLNQWQMALKRGLDLLGAVVLLGLAAPVMLLTAVAIRIEDGGAALFTQTRVGKAGEPFTIYKFRTMVNDAEKMLVDLTNDHEGPVFKMRSDPRITRVGNLLRKTSIDELPQIFNILKGDMSLVGPRPLPVHEVEAAPSSFLDRQAVKPGLTGRWQVSGRSDTGFKELDELDRWYVDNWSLGQDLEILARTVPAVLLARGAR